MKRLIHRQDGVAMVMVLLVMTLAVPIITAGLGLASTLSFDSNIKTQVVIDQYCALGGAEHALYRLLYDPVYIAALINGETGTYTIECNGEMIDVSILKHAGPPTFAYPSGDDTRRLQTTKVVTPTNSAPNVLTTFAYTITVTNRDDDDENLDEIHDKLPMGFSYVAGSAWIDGNQIEPTLSLGVHTWDLVGLGITVGPGESKVLTFSASAQPSLSINYCNEAWADPGAKATSSGLTARIEVGIVFNDRCPGVAVKITKTLLEAVDNDDATVYDPPNEVPSDTSIRYTYELEINNIGTTTVTMRQIRDLLPSTFTYVPASVTDFSTFPIGIGEPVTADLGGRDELTWDVGGAFGVRLRPGFPVVIQFDADAAAPPGDYWNEAWTSIDQLTYDPYTWPTARVASFAVIETQATDGNSTSYTEVWIGTDTYFIVEGDLQ